MASSKIIKRRIKSANNISQITRAMQMVAASKMKRAQAIAISGKPYALGIHHAVFEFLQTVEDSDFALFQRFPDAPKSLAILISTNKGLCGGLNSSLFRHIWQWFVDRNVSYITLGKKGRNFVARSGKELIADFSDARFLDVVPAVIDLIISEYAKGLYKDVYILYNSFQSALRYEPVRLKLLPFEPIVAEMEDQVSIEKRQFVIEPSAKEVLEALIPHYLETLVRSSILEADASEHSARMIAMKNATDNAKDLMKVLTLEYNKIRQSQITSEIADMVTARMSIA